ncbi:hypothetical protein [Paraburkholderia lycopersici]|uniref:Uncharacterized protein n=1 Tax=Paraburkholderia lycopersici TaxID=416944 RepID=A0A1G6ZGP1_9BURK|nr:hypothetical protein [Paraburkholderia lycopersici]SDE01750.1 hypothetical protein SAMN05421548_13081 [Paraburkholderia lycopersici]
MAERSDSPLWMSVWFDAGRKINGVMVSDTHKGNVHAVYGEALSDARRMCEQNDGIGFSIRRIAPAEVRHG